MRVHLVVVLVLLGTWVLQTPNPLHSAKSPRVVYVSNFRLLVFCLILVRVLLDVLVVLVFVVVVTGGKQSQLLVPRLKSGLWTGA